MNAQECREKLSKCMDIISLVQSKAPYASDGGIYIMVSLLSASVWELNAQLAEMNTRQRRL